MFRLLTVNRRIREFKMLVRLLCLVVCVASLPTETPRRGALLNFHDHHDKPSSFAAILDLYVEKYKATVAEFEGHYLDYPAKTAIEEDKFVWQNSTGWTSGFFPQLLWQLAKITDDQDFALAAKQWTAGRAAKASDTSTHDVGFMVFGSFGYGVEMGGMNKTDALPILKEAAGSLSKRYSSVVGMTRSWGSIGDTSKFEVIVDNLMNLELLLWVARETDNQTLTDIAVSHGKKTIEYFVREDGSSPHLCTFDPATGELLFPCTGTPQANTTWARGQSWAVYGFTMLYRYTHDTAFLDAARKVSDFVIRAAPADTIPLWDYEAKPPKDYKDTSASAIMAAGMLELSAFTFNPQYRDFAEEMMKEMTVSQLAENSPSVFQGNQADCRIAGCSIIETDTYFLEALIRWFGVMPKGY